MSLLPGGERGSRLFQICFAIGVVWAGYQSFVNLHRYQAVSGNLASLGDEINLNGEAAFRKELVSILEFNGVNVSADEVEISLDEARNAYMVSAPCRWTLEFPGHTFATRTRLSALIRRKIYVPPQ